MENQIVRTPAERKITIASGDEYRPKVEDIYDPQGFFYDSYRHAAACVKEILAAGEEYKEDGRDSSVGREKADWALLEYPNNVIAFCAERGQGKTSAMLSFGRALADLSGGAQGRAGERRDFWLSDREGAPRVEDCCYEVIESIDPSMMEGSDSILKVILSRLFNRLKSSRKSKRHGARHGSVNWDQAEEAYRNILLEFQRCFQNLDVLNGKGGSDGEDELEQIVELGDSGNMKSSLYQVISSFLEYVCDTKKSCLVLQIDDPDMSIEQAHKVIDDIRRYLILPRVIILLAINMQQLNSVVEQHFIAQYHRSIENGGMVTVETCHNIAARYVDKAIPGRRQIHLPDVNKEIGEKYGTIQAQYFLTSPLRNEKEDLLSFGDLHYQEQLLHYLYQKTGLILLPQRHALHSFLPGTLRELSHFLIYFRDMDKIDVNYWEIAELFSREDYEGKADEKMLRKLRLWQSNLSGLERYLVELWAPVHLHKRSHALLRSLREEPDASKNQYLLLSLPDYCAKERIGDSQTRYSHDSDSTLKDYRKEFTKACREKGVGIYKNGENTDINRSTDFLADVNEALNVLTQLPGGSDRYKFAYAVRLYYTIHMHQIMLNLAQRRASGKRLDVLEKLEDRHPLTDLIGGSPYKTGNVRGRRDDIIYSSYTLKASKLWETIHQMGIELASQSDRGVVEQFVRRVIPQDRGYKTERIQVEDILEYPDESRDTDLSFNVFYPLLFHLEELEKNRTVPVTKDVVFSLFLMLNWDVQDAFAYEFQLRGKGDSLSTQNIDLNDIRNVYAGFTIGGMLKQTARITGETRYEGMLKQATKSTGEPWHEDVVKQTAGITGETRHEGVVKQTAGITDETQHEGILKQAAGVTGETRREESKESGSKFGPGVLEALQLSIPKIAAGRLLYSSRLLNRIERKLEKLVLSDEQKNQPMERLMKSLEQPDAPDGEIGLHDALDLMKTINELAKLKPLDQWLGMEGAETGTWEKVLPQLSILEVEKLLRQYEAAIDGKSEELKELEKSEGHQEPGASRKSAGAQDSEEPEE